MVFFCYLSNTYSILQGPSLYVVRNWNYNDLCLELGKPNTHTRHVKSHKIGTAQVQQTPSWGCVSIPHLRILDLSRNFFNGSSKPTELRDHLHWRQQSLW
ncbi:unnamed protein product [Brassica rapa subsp. narinosa]